MGVANRVVLHIGAPKTGTTYLQAVLFQNKKRLKDQRILVPGKTPRDHGRAAAGVRQGPTGRRYADWLRLVDQIERWPDTVVISNEWFSMAAAGNVERALSDLSDTETHVVFTARDFVDQVPSAWQETLKLGAASSLERFIASLDDVDDTNEALPDVAVMRDRWRWSVLDPAEVLQLWGSRLPPSQVHVVTVPARRSHPTLLWQRFAAACGIVAAACDSDVSRARESVGVASARLLQEIGLALRAEIGADDGAWREAFPWIQRYLAHELLVPQGGQPIALHDRQFAEIRNRSRQSVEQLKAADYHVVGDLDDLLVAEPVAGGKHPDGVTDSELLEVAVALIPKLLGRVRTEHLRAKAAEAKAAAQL